MEYFIPEPNCKSSIFPVAQGERALQLMEFTVHNKSDMCIVLVTLFVFKYDFVVKTIFIFRTHKNGFWIILKKKRD